MVGQLVRVLLDVTLQIMAKIINDPSVWAFSQAADATSLKGGSLLDQCTRICLDGVLYNLHLVLVPFFERYTAVDYVKLTRFYSTVCLRCGATKSSRLAQMGKTL
jgi:hypothetical protein